MCTTNVPSIKNLKDDISIYKDNDILLNNGLRYAIDTEECWYSTYILKNSLSFGGINMSVVFKKF